MESDKSLGTTDLLFYRWEHRGSCGEMLGLSAQSTPKAEVLCEVSIDCISASALPFPVCSQYGCCWSFEKSEVATGLMVKLLVKRTAPHIRVLGFKNQSQLLTPASAVPGRQDWWYQELGSSTHMETWMVFQALGFGLTQFWLLQAFEEWTQGSSLSISLFLPLK